MAASSIAGRRAIRALASVAMLSGSLYAVDHMNACVTITPHTKISITPIV